MRQTNDELRRRALRLLAFIPALIAAVALALFLREAGRPYVLDFYLQRLMAVIAPLLILAAALGVGLLLLRLLGLKEADPWERLIFGAALGLCVLATLVLALGMLGQLQAALWIPILMVCAAAGAGEVYRLATGLWRSAAPAIARPNFLTLLWIIIAIFFLFNLTQAFVPPWEYDTQEYHLGVPAQHFMSGGIHFLADNAYAGFPANVENLYLLSMVIRGSPIAGAQSGIILNIMLGLLIAVAVWRLGRRLFSNMAGHAAAAIFYVWSPLLIYGGTAYVESALLFSVVAAMIALSHVLIRDEGDDKPAQWSLLCGLMTGFAIGVKYTSALMLLVPVGIVFAARVFAGPDRKRKCAHALIFVTAVLLAWSPWLIRNAVWTGNPTYPLLYSVFGGRHWDAARDAQFMHAHSPSGTSARLFFEHMKDFFFTSKLASILLIFFVPFVALWRSKWRPTALVFAYCAACAVLWFFFTQQIGRFLWVVGPFLALLSGAGLAWLIELKARPIMALFVLLLLLEPSRFTCYANWASAADLALGQKNERRFFEEDIAFRRFFGEKEAAVTTDFSDVYEAISVVNELPDCEKVLFIGEARTFYCRRPFVAPTVFNTQPIEQAVAAAAGPDDVYRALRGQGFTHLLINTNELIRLQDPTKAYGYIFQGAQRLGMLDGFNWRMFDAFATRHMKLAAVFGGMQTHPWTEYNWYRWEELLKQRKPPRLFVAVYELVESPQK